MKGIGVVLALPERLEEEVHMPVPPREGEFIHYSGRRFVVLSVEHHFHSTGPVTERGVPGYWTIKVILGQR